MDQRVYLDVWMPVGRMEEVMFALSVQNGLYQQLWLKADMLQCLDPSEDSHQVHRKHIMEVTTTTFLITIYLADKQFKSLIWLITGL